MSKNFKDEALIKMIRNSVLSEKYNKTHYPEQELEFSEERPIYGDEYYFDEQPEASTERKDRKQKYRQFLSHPKWQKKRLKIMERDNWTCVQCGETELQLHVHHKRYMGEMPWDTPDKYLETVCFICHYNEHKN